MRILENYTEGEERFPGVSTTICKNIVVVFTPTVNLITPKSLIMILKVDIEKNCNLIV